MRKIYRISVDSNDYAKGTEKESVSLSMWFTPGYEMSAPRSGSSHYTFRKQGCMPITVPKHEPIKKVYVEMVKQIVESEAKNDEDAE